MASVGVSCSRISQLAAEVKENGKNRKMGKWGKMGGNGGSWRKMEENGGKWGSLGNCGKLPKIHCGECRKNV